MKQNNYEQQNNQLYQLHLQRMKRRPKLQGQEQNLHKIIHHQQKAVQKPSANGEIYLNSVIYDKRQNSSKYNNIRLAQFLHQDINQFPNRPLSKNVQAILITTYGFETEVFLPILNTKVPFFVVNKEGEEKEGYVKTKYNGFDNFTLISPPKYNVGYGVFHTKLWLIKFTTFIRVVVCTSNNHFYDWTVWQNAFWFQDFPLQKEAQQKEASKDTQGKEAVQQNKDTKATVKDFDFEKDFVDTLSWVITEMQPKGFNVLEEMKIDFKNYSFKGVQVILIPSLPGRFKGQYLDKVGMGKVKKIMSRCSIQFKRSIMTYNSTSLGKLDEKFVRQVYFAFNPSIFQFLPTHFRLVYPTQRYIKDQTCGQANILFLTKENYQKSQLRTHIFYRYEQSSRNGVLGGIPHLKTAIVQQEGGEGDRCILYMGSHNLTKAAWGSYQKSDTQISCSNSELGLLFINYSKASLLKWLPYQYPPQKYSNQDIPYFRNFS